MVPPRIRGAMVIGLVVIALVNSGCAAENRGGATTCGDFRRMNEAQQQDVVKKIFADRGKDPANAELTLTRLSAVAYCDTMGRDSDPISNIDHGAAQQSAAVQPSAAATVASQASAQPVTGKHFTVVGSLAEARKVLWSSADMLLLDVSGQGDGWLLSTTPGGDRLGALAPIEGTSTDCIAVADAPGGPRVVVNRVVTLPAQGIQKESYQNWVDIYAAGTLEQVATKEIADTDSIHTSGGGVGGISCNAPLPTSDGRYATIGRAVVDTSTGASTVVTRYQPMPAGPWIAETQGDCANCLNGMTGLWLANPANLSDRHHVAGTTVQNTAGGSLPAREDAVGIAIDVYADPGVTAWAADGNRFYARNRCTIMEFDVMTGTHRDVIGVVPSGCSDSYSGIQRMALLPDQNRLVISMESQGSGNEMTAMVDLAARKVLWAHIDTSPCAWTAEQVALTANGQLALVDATTGNQVDFTATVKTCERASFKDAGPFVFEDGQVILAVDQ